MPQLSGPALAARLRLLTQFEVAPDGQTGEWMKLRSSHLTNKQLFMMLQSIWPAIVGGDARSFALLHCSHGRNAGVWFHVLPSSDYEPGCHEVTDL